MLRRKEVGLRQWVVQREPFTRRDISIGWVSIKLFFIPQSGPVLFKIKKNYCFWASLVAQMVKHLQCRRPGFDPWVGKIPWRRKWQPTQYSCLESPMDGGAW